MPRIDFLIPGDFATLTGGYEYDRRLCAGLAQRGFEVARPPCEPATIAAMPDGASLLIDGLALAGLADVLGQHAGRLHLAAIVHHPAALETGLAASAAAHIAADERRALQAMHCVIATSRWTADELLACGLRGERVHVVEPGVDAAFAAPRRPGERRDPAAAHAEGLQLLCVATLTPRKGHDTLIDALGELTDYRWQLECIGSQQRAPQHAAALARRIAERGLQDRIELRGELAWEAVVSAYRRADLFVLASHLEGYGMVLAEARAAGLPIVASGGGAVSDTLSGAAAIVVAPACTRALADALRGLMRERAAWLALAAAAAQGAAQPRSWQTVASAVAAILDSKR